MDWHEVVENLGPRLMRYFIAKNSKAEAADLVQEVLLRLVRRYREGAIDPTRGNIAMFAFGIAKNLQREGRKIQPLNLVPLADHHGVNESFSPDDVHGASEERQLLRQAIANLAEPEQQIIMLYMDDELTLSDIGQILGMPVGTVKSHIHRAKENLRTFMIRSKDAL